MLLAESDVGLAAQAAELATFAIVAAGGVLYSYGRLIPITVDVMSFNTKVRDKRTGEVQDLLEIQVLVGSRTRDAVKVTDFGYIVDPGPAERKWRTVRERVDELQDFAESNVPPEGVEVLPHSIERLIGSIPASKAQEHHLAVVVGVGNKPFIRSIPMPKEYGEPARSP